MRAMLKIVILSIVSIGLSSSVHAARKPPYKVTFVNQSQSPYYIFTSQSPGSKPIILKAGETSKSISLKEIEHLYLATPKGVSKLMAQQTYPFPTILITKAIEGFDTEGLISEQGRDMLVTFDAQDNIKLTNLKNK